MAAFIVHGLPSAAAAHAHLPSPAPAPAASQVVWGATKTAQQIVDALHRIAEKQGMAAATRVTPEVAEEVRRIARPVLLFSVAQAHELV